MFEAAAMKAESEPIVIGRYALFNVLASGGMATVHLGRLLGPVGFGRTVAIKRLHSHFTSDPEFVTMFMDEAHIVARIRHPNVVPMVDVIESSKGLFLVMEYVHGESFSRLLRTSRAHGEPVPLKLLTSIMHGALLGLHAAHETKGSDGELLDVVHRDVSPQNVIVGADGVARVLDFGVAKAAGRAQVTREGQIKGKLTYMAPEQIRGKVDRRADVFAAGVILWEALSGKRLHEGAKDIEIVTRVVKGAFEPPSKHRPDIPPELDAITMRALEADPEKRYQSAREFALDLERKIGLTSPSEVGEWVERLASDALQTRSNMVTSMEKISASLVATASAPPPAISATATHPNLHGSGSASEHVPQDALDGSYLSYTTTHDSVSTTMHATPHGAEVPVVSEGRGDHAPVVAILTFCGVLLLSGIALGGWSLYAGKTAQPPAASPASSVPSARASQEVPSPEPPASASSRPVEGRERAEPPPTPKATTGSSVRTVDAGLAVNPAPLTPPVRPYVPPVAPKKNECDPPFILDEAGHRKYKRECMGPD